MKVFIVILLVVCFIALIAAEIVSFANEPYAKPETEAKYLRNLSRFRMISDHHFYIDSDSLTDIAQSPFSPMTPFHRWYILDKVGSIRPWGELSKKLDSLSNSYKNKYE